MKILIRKSLLVIAPLFILCVTSCTLGSCFEETESYVKASFYSDVTKKITAPDSVTIYGLGRDTSLLYHSQKDVKTALLPLDSSSDITIFIIQINGKTDTVEFHYTTYPHLISKECGYTFYHHLDTTPSHTTHSIIDIYAASSTITNLNGENLRIFF